MPRGFRYGEAELGWSDNTIESGCTAICEDGQLRYTCGLGAETVVVDVESMVQVSSKAWLVTLVDGRTVQVSREGGCGCRK